MAAPFTKTTAITNAKTVVAAQNQKDDAAHRIIQEYADQYDSRWSRDPGRANGPYS